MDESKSGICRVCLAKSKTMYVSIHENYKDSCISDYIRAIADVQICVNDGLPDRICSSCLVELEQAVQFKQKCESSHHILTSIPPDIKIEDETDIKDIIVKEEEPIVQFSEPEIQYSELEIQSSATEIQCSEPDCDDQFEDNEDFKVNDKSEVKKSKAIDLHLQCDDCKELFKSKCKLRVHWKKVHLYEALKCPECKNMFKSFKAFNSHRKKRSCKYASKFRIEGEGKKRVFYCKQCTYSSPKILVILAHSVVHTGERPFKCHICFKTFTQLTVVKSHQEYSHPELFKEDPCHICGKLIKGPKKMNSHMKIHSEKEWSCLICSKKLKNKYTLRNHMKIHMGVKSYTCETCKKDFFSTAALANHRRVVHEKRIQIYKCDFCDYSSRNENVIAKHKVKHNDDNISCTVCGMLFESKQKLVLHKSKHFQEKIFACMYCEKMFRRKCSVPLHIKRKHKDKVPEQNDEALKKTKHKVNDNTKQIIESELEDSL